MKQMALETDFAMEFENCRKRCLELEEQSKMYETRCLMLEIEVENLKEKNQELEAKMTMIQKLTVDTINVVSDSEDQKMMIKNKCLSPSTPGVTQSAFRGIIDISDEDMNQNEIPKVEKVSGSRKIVNLEHIDEHMDDLKFHSFNTRSTKRKGAAKIFTSDEGSRDEDVNHNEIPNVEKVSGSCKSVSLEHIVEECMEDLKFRSPNTKSTKRKRAAKIITSDEEKSSDEDVNHKEIPKVEKVSGSSKSVNLEHIDEECMEDLKFHSPNTRSIRRKRAAKIITRDEEKSSDEDVNHKEIPNVEKVSGSSKSGNLEHIDEECMEDLKFHSLNTRIIKRKRAAKIITSDEEKSSDEDVNHNKIPNSEMVSGSNKSGNLEHIDEECMEDLKFHSPNTRSTQRKRVAKIITSDGESSDEDSYDDNAPICTLKKQHTSTVMIDSEEEIEEYASKSQLRRLRKSVPESKQNNNSSFDLIQTVSLSEDEDDAEDESLDGFIDDGLECENASDSDSETGKEEAEKALNKYKKSLEKLRRKKSSNSTWDLEADMLADFGKDPELCMRAVCALYRRQTDDEKEGKVTIYHNERGFSHLDAYRGSELAEFLTNGDPSGDVTKTVEELEEYYSEGIEMCRKLAYKYSKQLFEIYQNNEDPYFGPKR